MTDHADVIAAIQALASTRSGVTIAYGLGMTLAETMPAPPYVVWVEGEAFRIDPSARYGERSTVGTYVGGWKVYIWADTTSQAKAILFNLIQASRTATDGHPVTWSAGTITTEAGAEFAKRGALIEASCELSVPISGDPYPVTSAATAPEYNTITVVGTELTGATL